jgi:hypothetical protein
MLKGLDELPWKKWKHAYGRAEDVPALIRKLADAKGDPWEEGHPVMELCNSINHQGSTYEATAPAVPFLIELAVRRETPCRLEVFFLLASIAQGNYEGPSAGRNPPRAAVLRGVEIIAKCLKERDAMVQLAAMYVLACFPERGETFAPRFLALYAKAGSRLVRAGILLCMRNLGDSSEETLAVLRRESAPGSRTVRLAAALAWAKVSLDTMPQPTRMWLSKALQSEWVGECFRGVPWDYDADIDREEIIDELGPAVAATALQRRITQIVAGGKDASLSCGSAIYLAFPHWEKERWEPGIPLSEAQRELLMVIVQTDGLWKGNEHCGFGGALGTVGLPMSRHELAELLRVDVPGLTDLGKQKGARRLLAFEKMKPGRRVFHEAYGFGTVRKGRMEDSDSVSIEFDKEGRCMFTPGAKFYEV